MKKYIISPVTVYDEEQGQYATKVGVEGNTMMLHYTVWGLTEIQSRERAERLGQILTAHYDENVIKKRIEAAESYLTDEAEQLHCEGAVYSESGWRYTEVMNAIKIAAGTNNPTEKQ